VPRAQGASTGGAPKPMAGLAWNPKVQHILATASSAGSVSVVDLKKQKPIMELSDNQGCAQRCILLCS
jgi:hypothetical protein